MSPFVPSRCSWLTFFLRDFAVGTDSVSRPASRLSSVQQNALERSVDICARYLKIAFDFFGVTKNADIFRPSLFGLGGIEWQPLSDC